MVHEQPAGSSKRAGNVGVILVHSRGRESRYEALTALVSRFYERLRAAKGAKDRGSGPRLRVETEELYRRDTRPPEGADLARPAAADPGGRSEPLFRPATIHVPETDDNIRFYEVYWTDSDFRFSAYEKVKCNLWLLTTLWNPLFNRKTYRADRNARMGAARFAKSYAALSGFGLVYHLSELPFLILGLLFRKTRPWGLMGRGIYDYAGDLKRYTSQDRFFHDQTKKDVILARFDEVVAKAYLENDELHVIGDGFGSVVLLDGLTRHPVHPSKMSEPFRAYLAERHARWQAKPDKRDDDPDCPTRPIDLSTKLRTIVTLGGPLDRFYLVWPSRRDPQAQPAYRLEPRSGEPLRWTAAAADATGSTIGAEWFHFYESADPLGERVEHMGGGTLPSPENHCLANHVFPSRARAGYFQNESLMSWLVGRVDLRTDSGTLTPPPDAPRGSRLWRFGINAALALLTAAIGIRYIVVSGTDFALRLLHDFYEDVESDTLFSWFAWLDRTLVAIWTALGLGGTWLDRLVGFGGVALAVVLLSGAASFHYHRRSEAEHERQRRKLGLG